MTAFPKVFSFPRRRKIFTLSLVLIFVALAFETPGKINAINANEKVAKTDTFNFLFIFSSLQIQKT